MKLNIQLFASKKEADEEKEVKQEEEQENYAEQVAVLNIKIDELSENIKKLDKEKKELESKNKDLNSANLRLMDRLYERAEKEDKKLKTEKEKPVKLSDYYDFKNGRLSFKE